MYATAPAVDLIRACEILFSPEQSSLSFLRTLSPEILKIAFRKKALETHPDRAAVTGGGEDLHGQKFHQVKMAYDLLLPVAQNGFEDNTGGAGGVGTHANRHFKKSYKVSSYHTGKIPNHRLKFGHFMYYSGMISWNQLIDAVTYHRRVRPRYGEIALDWKMIRLEEIGQALRQRGRGEMIGEYMQRVGWITGFQHLAIMGKQKRFHVLFGEYFVKEGIMTRRQLDIALIRAMKHNQGS